MHSNQVSFLHFLGHVFIRSDWPNCRRGAPLLPRNHWPKIGVTQWPWVIRRYRTIRQRITCTRGRLTSVLTSVQPRQVWCAIVHLWLSTGTGSGYTFLNHFWFFCHGASTAVPSSPVSLILTGVCRLSISLVSLSKGSMPELRVSEVETNLHTILVAPPVIRARAQKPDQIVMWVLTDALSR